MKKILSLLVAAVIVLSALVALASCGGSASIVGEWKADIDFVKMLGDEAGEAMSFLGENVLDAFKGKTVGITMNFKEDGKVTAEINTEDYVALMKDIVGGWVSEEELRASMEEQNGAESEYKYENGELTIEDNVYKVEVTASKLIIKEVVTSGEEAGALSSAALPLEFTRK